MSRGTLTELFDGAVDVIGDVHGEADALSDLLARLGYDAQGGHPERRRLVFVGDLIDRGPDSPAVLRRVASLVEAGRAQCITGNHELNALRNDPDKQRPGEGWWYGRADADYDSVPVDPDEKARRFLPFLSSLPIALENTHLRVVHACWHEESIEQMQRESSVIDAFRRHDREGRARLASQRRAAAAELDRAGVSLHDEHAVIPPLPLRSEYDESNQMSNPVRILTSGVEQSTGRKPVFLSGKWRLVERVPWWQRYAGETPVVFGHYWRRYDADTPAPAEKKASDLFDTDPPDTWLGNTVCIDYSVGYRFKERPHTAGRGRSAYCLAAFRFPERTLVFDDGRPSFQLSAPAPTPH